jgi:hypothetical protein
MPTTIQQLAPPAEACDSQTEERKGYSVQRFVGRRNGDRIKAFWDARTMRRKTPGNCSRCGDPKTEENKLKTCDKCREYNKKQHRERTLRKHAIKADAAVLAEIRQFRRELNALRAMFKKSQGEHKKSFARGRQSGIKAGFKNALAEMLKKIQKNQDANGAQSYADALPRITEKEMSEINHAYE